jgi:hypothetical protein
MGFVRGRFSTVLVRLVWRFVEEVDDPRLDYRLNRYGDWTRAGHAVGTLIGSLREALLSRTSEYWSRAEAVGMLLEGAAFSLLF